MQIRIFKNQLRDEAGHTIPATWNFAYQIIDDQGQIVAERYGYAIDRIEDCRADAAAHLRELERAQERQ